MQPDQSSDAKIARNIRAARKKNRDECIAEFFEEVDSNKIVTLIKEDSFKYFTVAIRKNALLIQKRLKPSGSDHALFRIPVFPFEIFCAFVSQFQFDRIRDVDFR
jgi:hypothetical protein